MYAFTWWHWRCFNLSWVTSRCLCKLHFVVNVASHLLRPRKENDDHHPIFNLGVVHKWRRGILKSSGPLFILSRFLVVCLVYRHHKIIDPLPLWPFCHLGMKDSWYVAFNLCTSTLESDLGGTRWWFFTNSICFFLTTDRISLQNYIQVCWSHITAV